MSQRPGVTTPGRFAVRSAPSIHAAPSLPQNSGPPLSHDGMPFDERAGDRPRRARGHGFDFVRRFARPGAALCPEVLRPGVRHWAPGSRAISGTRPRCRSWPSPWDADCSAAVDRVRRVLRQSAYRYRVSSGVPAGPRRLGTGPPATATGASAALNAERDGHMNSVHSPLPPRPPVFPRQTNDVTDV